jgi:hypothetical protein
MTRRFAPPQPFTAVTTPDGELTRVYRRRWLTVTSVLDRWQQPGLWWTEATTPEQAWLATERRYARIVLDGRQVWDVFHTAEGGWFLERIVLH